MSELDSPKVEVATDVDKGRWNDYLIGTGNGSLYHAFEWKNVMERSFGHKGFYLMAMEDGEIRGILPLVLVKGPFFGKLIVSMPFLNYGGICTSHEEVARALFNAAAGLVEHNGAKYLELRSPTKCSFDLPVKTGKVSMTIHLEADPEQIWRGFSTKLRTNIRRAEKNELKIKIGGAENLHRFYKVLSQNMRDLGTPIYREDFFKSILEELGDRIRIFLVLYQDKPIATAFNGHFKNTVEGLWASSIREYDKLQPNYFLYWEMIKYACENGFEYFHLGRSSTDSGSLEFKKKWNAVPQQLYWYYYLNGGGNLPELNPQNRRYRLPIKIWQKLPVWMTKIIGPPVAKGIP